MYRGEKEIYATNLETFIAVADAQYAKDARERARNVMKEKGSVFADWSISHYAAAYCG